MIDRNRTASLVKHHRRRLGISQIKLAERAGISIATVKRVEGGRNGSYDTLSALAKGLGVRVAELVESEPVVGREVEALISQWVKGEFFRPRLKPPVTHDEIKWLLSLPSFFWSEFELEEETLEHLIRARRVRAQSLDSDRPLTPLATGS